MDSSSAAPSALAAAIGSIDVNSTSSFVTAEDRKTIQELLPLLPSTSNDSYVSVGKNRTMDFAAYAAWRDWTPVASPGGASTTVTNRETPPASAAAPTARLVIVTGPTLYVLDLWQGAARHTSALPPYRIRLSAAIQDVALWVRSTVSTEAVLVCPSHADITSPELTTCADASVRLLRFVTAPSGGCAASAAADAFVAAIVRVARPDLARRCRTITTAAAPTTSSATTVHGAAVGASLVLGRNPNHVDPADVDRAARRDRLRLELAATQAALASGDVNALLSPTMAGPLSPSRAIPFEAASPQRSELTLAELEAALRTVVVECDGPLNSATDVLTELGLLRGVSAKKTSTFPGTNQQRRPATASVGCAVSFPHLSLPVLAPAALERGFAVAYPTAASELARNDTPAHAQSTTAMAIGAAAQAGGTAVVAAMRQLIGMKPSLTATMNHQSDRQPKGINSLSSDRPGQDALGLTGAPGSGSAAVGMNVNTAAMRALAQRILEEYGETTVAFSAPVRMRTESTHDCVVVTEASLIFAKARKDRLLCRVPLSAIDGCVLDANDPGLVLLQFVMDVPVGISSGVDSRAEKDAAGSAADGAGASLGGGSAAVTAATTGTVTTMGRDIVARFTTTAEDEARAAAGANGSPTNARRGPPTSSPGAKLRRQFVTALARAYEMGTLRRLRCDTVPDAARMRRGAVEYRVERWVGGLRSQRDQMLALARRGADSVVGVGKRLTTLPLSLVNGPKKRRKKGAARGEDGESSDGARTPRSSGDDSGDGSRGASGSDTSDDSDTDDAATGAGVGVDAGVPPADADAARRLLVTLLDTPLQLIQTLNAALPAVSCFGGLFLDGRSHRVAAGNAMAVSGGIPVDDLEYWARTVFRAQAAVDLRTQRQTLLQLLQLARWAESLHVSTTSPSDASTVQKQGAASTATTGKNGNVSRLCKELLRDGVADAVSLLSFEDTRALGVLRPVLATELARFAPHRRANINEAERVHRAVHGLVASVIRQARASGGGPTVPTPAVAAALQAKEAQLTQLRSRLVAVFPYLHDELSVAAAESAGASAELAAGASEISGTRSAHTALTGRHTAVAHTHGRGGSIGGLGGAGPVFPSAFYHIADPFQVSFTSVALRHYLSGSGRRDVALLPARWVAALGAAGQQHHVHEHMRSPARLRAASVGVVGNGAESALALPTSAPSVDMQKQHQQPSVSSDGAMSELLAARMILSEPLEAFYCDPQSLLPDPPMAVRVNWALSILRRFLPFIPPAVEYARRNAERTAPANGAIDFGSPAASFYLNGGGSELISSAVVSGKDCFHEALKVVAATIFDLVSGDSNLATAAAAAGDNLTSGTVEPSVGYPAEDWRSAVGSLFFSRFLYRNLCDPVGRKIVDASSLPVLSASQRRIQHSHLLDVMAFVQSVACLTPLPLLSRPFAYDAPTASALFVGVPLAVVATGGGSGSAATGASVTPRLDFAQAAAAALWEPMVEFLSGCVTPAAARAVSASTLLAAVPASTTNPLDAAAVAFTLRALGRCDGSAIHRAGRGECGAGLDVERFAWSEQALTDRRIARLLGLGSTTGTTAKVYDNAALAKKWHRVATNAGAVENKITAVTAAPDVAHVPVADAVQRALMRYLFQADIRAEVALTRVLTSLDAALREHVSDVLLASCAFAPTTAGAAWSDPQVPGGSAADESEVSSPTDRRSSSSLKPTSALGSPLSPSGLHRPVPSGREVTQKRNAAITAARHAATVRAAADAQSAHAAETGKLRRQIVLLQQQLAAANERELQIRREAATHVEWASNAAAAGFLERLHHHDVAAATTLKRAVARPGSLRAAGLAETSSDGTSSGDRRHERDDEKDEADEEEEQALPSGQRAHAAAVANPFLAPPAAQANGKGTTINDKMAPSSLLKRQTPRLTAAHSDALSRGPHGAGAGTVVGCPMDAAPLWGVGCALAGDEGGAAAAPRLDYGALSALPASALTGAGDLATRKPGNPLL